MTVLRGGEELTADAAHPGVAGGRAAEGTAVFGITIQDELEFDDDAVPVEIRSGSIFGPSAGLMFTLQIIDQLTPGGLTDLVVAGTGTIEPDGRVGRIGGVQQKVYTAEAAGADLMFVPRGNYEEAAAVAHPGAGGAGRPRARRPGVAARAGLGRIACRRSAESMRSGRRRLTLHGFVIVDKERLRSI